MSALAFRTVDRREAALRRQIGAGRVYPYVLAGEPGYLRLTLADDIAPRPMTCWQTDLGPVALSDAQPVLALMSASPTFALVEDAPEQAWYGRWWHQQLSGELLALFGHITLTEDNAGTGECRLWLTIAWGDQQAQSLLTLSYQSLSSLLMKAGWHQDAMPLPETLAITVPLITGELGLSLDALQSLQAGDVVLPDTLFFTPEGQGIVRCASRVLHGEVQMQPGATAHFYLTEMESTNVALTPDEFEQQHLHHPESFCDAEPVTEATDFAPLPLSLSVRCGQLKLTLGELQHLSAGAMVMIEHVTPGEAILCHGDYPLAKGELVDVEGKLGLQITHMLPGSKNPLSGGAW